ncbi:hypothetical protein APA_3829 [Pseudanabaena sp. lw0831]|nr:hypothetical protein APA_3829 [Pseudanabaena sp. lw0831]
MYLNIETKPQLRHKLQTDRIFQPQFIVFDKIFQPQLILAV